MIPASLYTGVYYNLLLLIVICAFMRNVIRAPKPISVQFNTFDNAFILFLFITLFIGLRPIEDGYLGDTATYELYYIDYQMGASVPVNSDWLFHHLMKICSGVMNIHVFLLFIASVYVGCVLYACRRLFPNNVVVGFLMYITALSFWGYGVNGIRSGIAASVMLLGMSYYPCKWKFALGSIIAIGFHSSIVLPFLCAVVSWMYSKTRLYYLIWLVCVCVSWLGKQYFSDFLLTLEFVDARLSGYINNTDDLELFSSVGFRWDFLLYSIPPLALGYYVVVKRKLQDKVYLLFLHTYILANAFWVLIIQVAYSNRFAYLSWFIYPLVLAYPLLKFQMWKQQYGKIALILLSHFAFTYFMWTIGKL